MQSSRGVEGRLASSASDPTGGPGAVSIPSIPVVTDTAASRTGASVDAAEPASSEAGPPVLSIKWGRKQVQRLQQQVCELPEDTAEEGRFLMMAALVGVITGTAGDMMGKGVLGVASVCSVDRWCEHVAPTRVSFFLASSYSPEFVGASLENSRGCSNRQAVYTCHAHAAPVLGTCMNIRTQPCATTVVAGKLHMYCCRSM